MRLFARERPAAQGGHCAQLYTASIPLLEGVCKVYKILKKEFYKENYDNF